MGRRSGSEYDTAGRLTWRGIAAGPGPVTTGIGFSFNYEPEGSSAGATRDRVSTVYGYAASDSTSVTAGLFVENGYFDNGQLKVRHYSDNAKDGRPGVERVGYEYKTSGLVYGEHRHNLVGDGFVPVPTSTPTTARDRSPLSPASIQRCQMAKASAVL